MLLIIFIFAELGGYLASKEIHVTFGGSKFGTMGKIAEGVLEKGGKLTGIIPKFFTGSQGTKIMHVL